MIWDGEHIQADISQQFHACKYKSNKIDHLCWHEASALGALRNGENASSVHDYQRVFDNTYTQVGQNYSSVGEIETAMIMGNFTRMEWVKSAPDSHEFHVVGDGKSFVQAVYYRKHMDLTPWNGHVNDWVLESCFQEVEFITERIIFNWCYLDWLPLETDLYLNLPNATNFTTKLAGDGSWFGAWDFFHINSIDKNDEGDYLISGRHADQIMKIAGPESALAEPGTPLWRLGGPSNQFEFEPGFNFTRQHHAKFISTTANWTMFSIFDNSWEGEGNETMVSTNSSSAKIIAINNVTMQANCIRTYYHPEGKLGRSGGSVQILPNNNVFVGWGYMRQVTEFHNNGTILMHATLRNDAPWNVNNYRNYKFPWTGRPAKPPTLIAYSKFCGGESTTSPLIAYVSWNGATEVARWRFLISERPGHWIEAGIFEKREFETRAHLADRFYPFVNVEAMDKFGHVIGQVKTSTFVPNMTLVGEQCDYNGCWNGTTVDYPLEYSCAEACWTTHRTDTGLGLICLIIVVEIVAFLYSFIVRREVELSMVRRISRRYAPVYEDYLEDFEEYGEELEKSRNAVHANGNGNGHGVANGHHGRTRPGDGLG